MKVQGTSGEISVIKNVGKIMQNVGSRRFTPKLAKVAMLANTQNSIIINKGKDFKILKNRFNSYGRQVDSLQVKKNILTVWMVGKFDIGHLGCWTSLVQRFGKLTLSGKWDLGHGPI